jgi:hypothetical protein
MTVTPGLLLLTLAPPAGFLTFAAVCAPQLVIVALFAAIMFVVPRVVTGTLFALCQQDMNVPALFILAHALAEEVARLKMLQWLLRAELFFQKSGGQVLHSRLTHLGVAVGVGFGLTQLLTGPAGTLAAYSYQFVSDSGDVAFNPSACVGMDALAHAGLQAFLLYTCQVCWSVLVVLLGLVPPSTATAAPANVDGGHAAPAPSPADASQREMQTAPRLAAALSSEGVDDDQKVKTPLIAARKNGSGATTTSRGRPKRVVLLVTRAAIRLPLTSSHRESAALAAVATLHVLFVCFSFLNSGAVDRSTMQADTLRGCGVSLPLQAIVTALSLSCAVWAAGREAAAKRVED